MIDCLGLLLTTRRIKRIIKEKAGLKECSVTTVENEQKRSTVIQTADSITVAFEQSNSQTDSE